MADRALTRLLSDGRPIPLLALGVWQIPDGDKCVNAVRAALEAGYRHVDTAQAYGNEESVGRALRESGLSRDEVFVTTKFYPGNEDPVREAENSLKRLRMDSVDLYLIHWPEGETSRIWEGMERARDLGYTKSIGVSNFDAGEVAFVAETGAIASAVNQVQFSPFEFRRGLLDACTELGVVLEAYSPLGTGRHLGDETVRRIADGLRRSPAQVLLRWCLERQVPVISKSTRKERIVENTAIFDFSLSAEDIAALDSLDRTGGTNEAREGKWW
jgi:diketogulonate reductase-like aldo/keto reductase